MKFIPETRRYLHFYYISFYHLCRCFYDIMHYTLREVLSHKLIATPPPARLIKVPVSSHGSERSCACVLDVSIMPLYTVLL